MKCITNCKTKHTRLKRRLLILLVLVQLLSQGAFGYLLPITSFILVWLETWLLDFKVLPQEAIAENSETTVVNFVKQCSSYILLIDFIFSFLRQNTLTISHLCDRVSNNTECLRQSSSLAARPSLRRTVLLTTGVCRR